MAPQSKLRLALSRIESSLNERGKNVFTHTDIRQLLSNHRSSWQLPESTSLGKFVATLIEFSALQEIRIDLPHRPAVRYAWNSPTTMEIVQSLSVQGYFSHYSAIFLHGLTTQIPKSMYFNIEQPARGGGGTLTQPAIDRAFRNAGRVSSNVTSLNGYDLHVINGQNTDRLGVIDFSSSAGRSLRVTNVERTLIDAAVRPQYAGGIHEVAGAFAAAHDKLSVNRILAYLRKLNFTYPYHQAIGFYLQRTGMFSSQQLDMFKELEMSFNFYLTYGMKETEYIPEWRLFVPKGFQL
jgi:predicted transcriptional regulator of viral defense system